MLMYVNHPRRFANEYEIGIATSDGASELYERMGFDRISRDRALSYLTRQDDAATRIYASVSVSVDGAGGVDRFEAARSICAGRPLPRPAY